MKAESLTQIISELSTEEQSAVREFIAFLKEQHRQQPAVAFQTALDEFISAHPELLRRLAERHSTLQSMTHWPRMRA